MKRVIPLFGAMVCLVGCAGLPTIAAALAAVGLSALCDNRLLVPIEVVLVMLAIRSLGTAFAKK
ncbi:MAG TPA: hypothetical protein VFA43_01685 [Gemmatimonadaceae bacterium]|nr:hypothetical protein [Gemmatimonadaceae bacterium]